MSRVLSRTFHALRNRNFRLFFVGQTISNTGNGLTNVALILFVLQLTHSGFAVGALAACQFGPLLLLSAWAGVVADRGGEKRSLLLSHRASEMLQQSSSGWRFWRFIPFPHPIRRWSRSTAWRSPAASCSPSTTRCGARSCRRWCPRTIWRTPWSSTAPSSASRRSSGPRWPGSSPPRSALGGASRSMRPLTWPSSPAC